jgi:hypothetical protein
MGQTSFIPHRLHGLLLGALLCLAPAAFAVEVRFPERNATRTLQMTTPTGEPLGEGTLTAWNEGEQLHVVLTYRYDDGRLIEESSLFRQQPELIQERWTWRERRGDTTTRQYAIDFTTGQATGVNRTGGKARRYNEKLKVEPGRTFAGVGFVLAAKNLMPELREGQVVKLQALAFTPKPRQVTVSLSRKGSEQLTVNGQALSAQRIVIHPEIGLASLVVKAPDTLLSFSTADTPMLVAGQGSLLEPGDPVVRTQVVPRKQAPAAARRAPKGSRPGER